MPGDYFIRPTVTGWSLTIVDRLYVPVTIAISSNGVPQQSID